MTTDEVLHKSGTLLGLAKMVLSAASAIIIAVIAIAIWVHTTSSSVAQMRLDIDSLRRERIETIQDYARWRSEIDKLVAKLVAIQDGQNVILTRHQNQLDVRSNRGSNSGNNSGNNSGKSSYNTSTD